MAPWVRMPNQGASERQAALLDAELGIAGVRCVLGLLTHRSDLPLQRSVLDVVVKELARVEAALLRLR